MLPVEITKEEILAVYPKVAQIMADALGCDVEQVELSVSLIEGLNAESIDFLDIIFHLERTFKVKIPRGKIVEDARGNLPEAAFEQKGHLTEAGLEHLRKFLSEVPADRFRSPVKVADIPRLFTPETFCKVVVRALRAGPAALRGVEGLPPPRRDLNTPH
jgi:acyl carrier protein